MPCVGQSLVVRLPGIFEDELSPEARDNNCPERRGRETAWAGMVSNPNDLPKPSRIVVWLRALKPTWSEWVWLFVAISVVLGIIATFIKLW
jgi:hypothetical protein